MKKINLKLILLFVTTPGLLAATAAYAEAKAEAKSTDESSSSTSVGRSPITKLGMFTSYTEFYFENIGFNSSRHHWDNPSTFSMDNDGSWYFYAKRIANFDRSWTDTGRTWSYRLDVQYFTGGLVNDNCTGQQIHSNRYVFGSVSYKEEKHNTSRRGSDPIYAEKSPKIQCAVKQSWWYSK